MKRLMLTLAITAGLLATATQARAAALAPGGSSGPGPLSTPVSGTPTLLGNNLAAVSQGGVTGSLRSAVFSEGGGVLDFVFQLTNNSTSTDNLRSLTLTNYRNMNVTDVGFQDGFAPFTAAGFTAPSGGTTGGYQSVNRSTAALNGGSSIGFGLGYSSSTLLTPGQATSVLVIRVANASSFALGQFAAITDGVAGNYNAFSPTPEPASLVLMGGCFAGLGGFRAWRRRQSGSVQN